MHRLERQQFVPRPRDEVFAFFAEARNLEMLTPAFLNFRILRTLTQIILLSSGARVVQFNNKIGEGW